MCSVTYIYKRDYVLSFTHSTNSMLSVPIHSQEFVLSGNNAQPKFFVIGKLINNQNYVLSVTR